MSNMDSLNLGSYRYPIKSMWNVDIQSWPGVNQIADLNVLPWPWEDGRWSHVRAIDIVEHLGSLTKVQIVSELARVVKIGGTVEIRVPCATHRIALQSIQHAHTFYFDSFETSYAQPYFEVTDREVSFWGNRLVVPFVSPFRAVVRLLGLFGMVYCITYRLRRLGVTG